MLQVLTEELRDFLMAEDHVKARRSHRAHSIEYKKMEANMKRESLRQGDVDKEISKSRGDALYKRRRDKDIEHALQDAEENDDSVVDPLDMTLQLT